VEVCPASSPVWTGPEKKSLIEISYNKNKKGILRLYL